MRDGRLFRYGEVSAGIPQAALLEEDFAAMQGAKYCAAVNSGGCALFLSLKAAGVEPGDRVLLNAFTLAPVPGAIAHAGARGRAGRYRRPAGDRPRRSRTQGRGLRRKTPAAQPYAWPYRRSRRGGGDLRPARPDHDRGLRAHDRGALGGPPDRLVRRGGVFQRAELQACQRRRGRADRHRRRGHRRAGGADVRLLHALRPAPRAARSRRVRALARDMPESLHAHERPDRRIVATPTGRDAGAQCALARDLRPHRSRSRKPARPARTCPPAS